jgi:AcrR family transcriptional regulator
MGLDKILFKNIKLKILRNAYNKTKNVYLRTNRSKRKMNTIVLNKKQSDILATAKELFWKYGFKKVSIEEICREAKTSKVTFYKFYGNKIEIAKAIIDQIVVDSMNEFNLLIEHSSSISELFGRLLEMKKNSIHEISKEFLADFYADNSLGLKEYIRLKGIEVGDETKSGLKKLQERGLIRKDMNIEFFIYFSKQMNTLMEDPYLLSLFPSADALIMEITNLFTYGMTPRNEE